jgi:hypothetical protein
LYLKRNRFILDFRKEELRKRVIDKTYYGWKYAQIVKALQISIHG